VDNSYVVTLPIEEIFFDEDIYPRLSKSPTTEDAYKEALEAGATFPPIEVQYVNVDGERKTLLLDGYNRWKAHGEAGRETIEAVFWKEGILDKDENLVDLMVRAAELNTKHGLRLSQRDAKNQLQKIAETEEALNLTWKNIAKKFDVTPEWVFTCVSAILAAKRMSRDAIMYKLSLLGWNQEEIGNLVDMAQPHVSENIRKLKEFKISIIEDFYDKGKPVEEIAEYYNLDMPLLWRILLDENDDISRLEKLSEEIKGLKCNPRPYDVWNFAECCDLMGYKYKGRIPGQIVLQLLYFFTEPGDLVIDPMAGSGTVVDACLLMSRECLAFDNSPESYDKRGDIREGEALEAIQSLKRKPDLIFLDPPYFKKLEEEYGPESISALSRDEYLDFFSELAGKSYESGAKRIALLMSDYTDDEDPKLHIFVWDYVERFIAEKWIVERHIMSPLPTQLVHPDYIEKFRISKKLARLGRSLVIFRRP